MATVATTVANRIEVVEWGVQDTAVAAIDIVAGTFISLDANGNWVAANATTAPLAAGARLALRTVKTGESVTGLKSGVVSGYTVTQAFDATLYISDTGTLADAAGTVSVVAGRVIVGRANLTGVAADKLVRIDLPN